MTNRLTFIFILIFFVTSVTVTINVVAKTGKACLAEKIMPQTAFANLRMILDMI